MPYRTDPALERLLMSARRKTQKTSANCNPANSLPAATVFGGATRLHLPFPRTSHLPRPQPRERIELSDIWPFDQPIGDCEPPTVSFRQVANRPTPYPAGANVHIAVRLVFHPTRGGRSCFAACCTASSVTRRRVHCNLPAS